MYTTKAGTDVSGWHMGLFVEVKEEVKSIKPREKNKDKLDSLFLVKKLKIICSDYSHLFFAA